jgi:hypothetical protein
VAASFIGGGKNNVFIMVVICICGKSELTETTDLSLNSIQHYVIKFVEDRLVVSSIQHYVIKFFGDKLVVFSIQHYVIKFVGDRPPTCPRQTLSHNVV